MYICLDITFYTRNQTGIGTLKDEKSIFGGAKWMPVLYIHGARIYVFEIGALTRHMTRTSTG